MASRSYYTPENLSIAMGTQGGLTRATAIEATGAANLYRQTVGANQTSNYWNYNLCKADNTVNEAQLTGPLGPRRNITCKFMYPAQVDVWRQFQLQAALQDQVTPDRLLVIPNDGPIQNAGLQWKRKPANMSMRDPDVANAMMTMRLRFGAAPPQ